MIYVYKNNQRVNTVARMLDMAKNINTEDKKDNLKEVRYFWVANLPCGGLWLGCGQR